MLGFVMLLFYAYHFDLMKLLYYYSKDGMGCIIFQYICQPETWLSVLISSIVSCIVSVTKS